MLTSATNQEENIEAEDKNSHQEAVKSNNTFRDIATNKKIEDASRRCFHK